MLTAWLSLKKTSASLVRSSLALCALVCVAAYFFFVSYKQENAEPTVQEGKQV